MMTLTPEQEHLRKIATPLRLMQTVGKPELGYEVQTPPHLLYLEGRILEAVMDREHQRFIIVTLPPRHSKTSTIGVGLPAWYLGMFPDDQVIYASYAEDFAVKQGRKVRDLHTHHGLRLFGRGVSKDAFAAADWKLEGAQGGMLSAGNGGPITGVGGNLVIGDDLIKNARDANSEAEKAALIEWYDEVLRTRLEPGGTLILFFTRWRVDDLIGTLLERMGAEGWTGDEYEVINLPALATLPDEIDPAEDPDAAAEWTDVLGRHVGEALWPERYPAPLLHQMRANKADTFQAMFQGDPRVKEGGMFPRDKWRFYTADAVPEASRRLRIWDLAASEASGDWTVGALWGTTDDGRLVLYDVQRFRKDPSGVQQTVVSTAARDTAAVPILIEEERAGAGKTVVALYTKALRGFNVEGVRPEGDKELRAKPYSTIVHNGDVWLPSEAPWLEAFLSEHEGFPKMRHDDMVDTGSYATQKLVAIGETTMLMLGDLLTGESEVGGLVEQFAMAAGWG